MPEPMARRELEMRLKFVADASGAIRTITEIGNNAAKAEQHVSKLAQAARQVGSGGPGSPGGTGPSSGGYHPASSLSPLSRTAAFDRPVPVVIVGPRPLQVTGPTGGGTGQQGVGGSQRDREEKKEREEDRMGRTLSILRNLGLGGVAGNIGQFQGYGEAATEMGFGRLGKGLGRAAGLLGVGKSALELGSGAAAVMHDSYLTDQQKARALVRLDPTGIAPWVQKRIDEFSGRTAQFERVRAEHEKGLVGVHGGIELASFQLGFNPQRTGDVARAEQLRRARPVLESNISRTTAEGEREFREQQRMLPIERERAKAQREMAVETAKREAAQKELNKLERRATDLGKLRDRQAAAIDKGGSGPAYFGRLLALSETQRELQGVSDLSRQAKTNVFEADKRRAEAQRALRMSDVQMHRERAGILEERAGTAAGGARALGGMSPIDRAWAVEAVKMVQQYGPDMVPPEILARAQSVAGNTIGKITETRGASTREFQELQRIAPADFAGNPEELRRQAAEARNQAASGELGAEREVAVAIEKGGKDLGAFVSGIISRLIRSMKEEIDNNMKQMKGTT